VQRLQLWVDRSLARRRSGGSTRREATSQEVHGKEARERVSAGKQEARTETQVTSGCMRWSIAGGKRKSDGSSFGYR
jgi:hypothetical protein